MKVNWICIINCATNKKPKDLGFLEPIFQPWVRCGLQKNTVTFMPKAGRNGGCGCTVNKLMKWRQQPVMLPPSSQQRVRRRRYRSHILRCTSRTELSSRSCFHHSRHNYLRRSEATKDFVFFWMSRSSQVSSVVFWPLGSLFPSSLTPTCSILSASTILSWSLSVLPPSFTNSRSKNIVLGYPVSFLPVSLPFSTVESLCSTCPSGLVLTYAIRLLYRQMSDVANAVADHVVEISP